MKTSSLPYEVKVTYAVFFCILVLIILFIVFVVVVYNRKQLLYFKEKELRESEYRNRLLQKELEKQKSIEKERERISHDMHDDLGAGISALKLQAEFLMQKAEGESFKADIEDLLKTSEEMNLSMRELLWSLNPGNDSLGSFTDYAESYARNFLKKTGIALHIVNENIQYGTAITTEQRRNLFLCLKETLNNAYKHSCSSQLNISFIRQGDEFVMEISDNGIGIDPDRAKGNGLRNMKQRMQEQNGHCEITGGEGTRLSFRLKLN